MKLTTFVTALMLLATTAFAHDHEGKKKTGHDKEHAHVKADKVDHEHDEAHHGDHDHKAHHPDHKDGPAVQKKKK
jgi:hypothetical protein